MLISGELWNIKLTGGIFENRKLLNTKNHEKTIFLQVETLSL